MKNHHHYMQKALGLARVAARRGEVPIGALLIQDGKILARGYNLTKTWHDPTAHAEIVVLQKAAQKIKNERILRSVLYVSLEPCAMCAGAIVQARIEKVVFGAKDPKAGACGSVLKVFPNRKLNHQPNVIKGILAEESGQLLKDFFRKRRFRPTSP